MARDNEDRHLFRLRELEDYVVADNEPDVRGWDLVDGEKEKIGVIDEFIVDKDEKKVRYLDVVATRDLSIEGGERHFIVPIGVAKINDQNKNVIVREVDKETLMSIPHYTGEAITRDYEFDVVERLQGERNNAAEAEFYNNEFYNEENFYTHRADTARNQTYTRP